VVGVGVGVSVGVGDGVDGVGDGAGIGLGVGVVAGDGVGSGGADAGAQETNSSRLRIFIMTNQRCFICFLRAWVILKVAGATGVQHCGGRWHEQLQRAIPRLPLARA